MIKIQKETFNVEEEIQHIKKNLHDVGAVSIFIGYVRNINNDKKISSIDLDVYKAMAKKSVFPTKFYSVVLKPHCKI